MVGHCNLFIYVNACTFQPHVVRNGTLARHYVQRRTPKKIMHLSAWIQDNKGDANEYDGPAVHQNVQAAIVWKHNSHETDSNPRYNGIHANVIQHSLPFRRLGFSAFGSKPVLFKTLTPWCPGQRKPCGERSV